MIHSDLQRGFIRAEVIDWRELLEIGSWSKAREVGQAARRRQGLRGPGRRRARDPLQRVAAARTHGCPGSCAVTTCWPSAEVAVTRKVRRRGSDRPGSPRRRARAATVPAGAHVRHAVPDRRRVLRPLRVRAAREPDATGSGLALRVPRRTSRSRRPRGRSTAGRSASATSSRCGASRSGHRGGQNGGRPRSRARSP